MGKILLLICSFLVMTSCKKESVEIEESALPMNEYIPEKGIHKFTMYEIEFTHGITWTAFCSNSGISQNFRFRMQEPIIHDGKVFYRIRKKSIYDYNYGAYEIDWTETPGYYRYSFDEKKSYHYSDTNDVSPALLMDFNLAVGDSILIDSIGNGVYFIVEQVDSEMIESVEFPKLIGRIRSHTDYNYLCTSTELFSSTPYFPNPFWLDNNLQYYWNHDWTVDNFDVSYGGVYSHSFHSSLRDLDTYEAINNASIGECQE